MDSILDSVKKLLGMDSSYNHFDTDLVLHINSVLSILYQIGVGSKSFFITGSNEKWNDFIPDFEEIEMVKSYTALKVRMLFDPPTGGVATAIENSIKEFETRISYAVEGRKEENGNSIPNTSRD